jgi:hypothetical protein
MAELGRRKAKKKRETEMASLRGYHREPRCMSEQAA